MPSAEQINNRRRGRAKDQIPGVHRKKPTPALPARSYADTSTTSAPDSSRSASRSGGHEIDSDSPDLAVFGNH